MLSAFGCAGEWRNAEPSGCVWDRDAFCNTQRWSKRFTNEYPRFTPADNDGDNNPDGSDSNRNGHTTRSDNDTNAAEHTADCNSHPTSDSADGDCYADSNDSAADGDRHPNVNGSNDGDSDSDVYAE